MGVERVDYVSDEEFDEALSCEARSEEEAYEQHLEEQSLLEEEAYLAEEEAKKLK